MIFYEYKTCIVASFNENVGDKKVTLTVSLFGVDCSALSDEQPMWQPFIFQLP